jgi:hypothetical protein
MVLSVRKIFANEISVDMFVKELSESEANIMAPVVFNPPLNTVTSFQPVAYAEQYLGKAKEYCINQLVIDGVCDYTKSHSGTFAALVRRDDIFRYPTNKELKFDIFDLGQEEILGKDTNIQTTIYNGHVVEKTDCDLSKYNKCDRLVKTIFSTVVTPYAESESVSTLIGDANVIAGLINTASNHQMKFNGYSLFVAGRGKVQLYSIIASNPIDAAVVCDDDIIFDKDNRFDINAKARNGYSLADIRTTDRLPKRYYDFTNRIN